MLTFCINIIKLPKPVNIHKALQLIYRLKLCLLSFFWFGILSRIPQCILLPLYFGTFSSLVLAFSTVLGVELGPYVCKVSLHRLMSLTFIWGGLAETAAWHWICNPVMASPVAGSSTDWHHSWLYILFLRLTLLRVLASHRMSYRLCLLTQ